MFLCGDVMTGRGIDQVLPYPVRPVLYEPYVQDAREYVQLAEAAQMPTLANSWKSAWSQCSPEDSG